MTPELNATCDGMNAPPNINSIEWHQATGHARQVCAKIFANGGAPADALSAFGLSAGGADTDWSKAVSLIAQNMCAVATVQQAA